MSFWKVQNGMLIEAPNAVYHRDYTLISGKIRTDEKLPDGWQEHADEVSAREAFGLAPITLREAMDAEGVELDEECLWRVVERMGRKIVSEEAIHDGYHVRS